MAATRWLLFCFLLKRCCFDLKKKRIDPGDPMTQSKPGARALDRAGYRARSKNYGPKVVESTLMIFLNKKDNILNKNDRLEFTWQPKTLAFFRSNWESYLFFPFLLLR
jgi:hypothetical protein